MYLGEFRLSWQPFLAATLGLGLGAAISHYTLSLFGPPLLAEFGWSKSQFALIGSVPLATLFLVPVAGRLTDRFGARAAALVGFTMFPLGFLALAMMSGSIIEFFAIWLVQHIFGILTTSLVFCRVVVERFDRARGLALSLIMTSPPLVGAIAAPLMSDLIAAEGWRAGYVALALVSAAGGLVAVLLMGPEKRKRVGGRAEATLSRRDLAALLRNPTFLLIIIGMFLVNVPQVFATSQIKLAVLDRGMSDDSATWMVSMFAIGVIVGRFLSGLALDRIKPHLVAIAALGLPAIGYLLFASSTTSAALLSLGIIAVGLAQGAESDIGAYLISRRFELKNFSMLLSCVTAMIVAGTAVGSVVLSITLELTDSYVPFLLLGAVATLLGATLFALTGHNRLNAASSESSAEEKLIEQAIAGEIG
jgi:MFS family permease